MTDERNEKPPPCFEPREVPAYSKEPTIDEAIPISGVDVKGFDDPVLEKLPTAFAGALTLYVEHRIKPGGFLHSMLAGDLVLASAYETDAAGIGKPGESLMPIVAYWIWRYAPRESFGSFAVVESWCAGDPKVGEA